MLDFVQKVFLGVVLIWLICPLAANAGPKDSQQRIDWEKSTFSGTARRDALSPAELETYREDRRYVRGMVEPDVATSLNYADPRVYRFVLARLKMAGKTPQTAPRLFELIRQKRADQLRHASTATSIEALSNTRKRQHFMNSSNFLAENSPFMEANAIVTFPGGASYLYVDSASWDNSGNALGAMGYGETYGGSVARSVAIGDVSLTASQDYEVDSYSFMDTPIGLLESYVTRENNKRCEFDLSTLFLSDPLSRQGSQCIDICLNRTWTGDCDYDLTHDTMALKIPLRGSIGITFDNKNCVFDQETITKYRDGLLPPPGFIKVVLANTGGGCDVDPNSALYTPMQNFWKHTTISADGRTLTWDLTGQNAALFDQSCRQVQDRLELTMAVGLPMIQGGARIPPRPIVISNELDSQATDYQLPCITMTNSCLAAGTSIQLADGREASVESIQAGDKTFNPYHPDGAALTVTDTAQGFETAPMVRIKDEAGRSLLMTEMHPIATMDRGMVQARKLRVGDKVQTRTGPSQLVSVTREPFPGKVYNLKVGSAAESLKLGSDQTVVYANGFLVGDGQIQQKYEIAEQTATAKSDVRKRLPAVWLKDFVKSATR